MKITARYSIYNNLWHYCCAYYLPMCGSNSMKLKALFVIFPILAPVGINALPGGNEFSNSSRIFIFVKSHSEKVKCMQQAGRSFKTSSQSSYLSLTIIECFLALA